jgi:hypothetical protein
MPARFLLRISQRLFAGVFLVLGGCSYLPPTILPVDKLAPPSDIQGVTDLLTPTGPQTIRILFIHGIGVHNPCDPDTLLLHLTKALRVEQDPPGAVQENTGCTSHFAIPEPTPVQVAGATDTAFFYRYDFSSKTSPRRVKFAFLLWSPLTNALKATMSEDIPHHALLADVAKQFEQDNLVDVVLYGGRYRDVLRPAVEKGLCYFVDGAPDPSDPRICDGGKGGVPTTVITHSLGGYMLMDAMSDVYNRRKNKVERDPRSAAEKVGRDLNQFFMLANQLKLLDLTTRRTESQPTMMVENFRASWREANSSHKRQLVAISDPNDILSFQVTAAEIDKPQFNATNVYLGTAGEFFGLYRAPILPLAASPVDAHENYLKDDDVMDIIVCGMTGATIKRCGR